MSRVAIGFKTSPQNVDWQTLDATWALAGRLGAFDGGWLNDHLTAMADDRSGPSLEGLTLAAALAHRLPGLRIGHAVLSNTFRHPAITAKAATVMDHATGGRYVLGLGAGWHEGEHRAFGIPLPPIKERIDRLESAVATIRALLSRAASAPPGVTRDDPFFPLHEATNEPGPLTPGGPPLYLGGQGPRGLALAAREADGWITPGPRESDIDYFTAKRDNLRRGLEAAGRDPEAFAFVGQVHVTTEAATRRAAVASAIGFARAGATEVVLGMPAALGPAGLQALADDVARPLRDALG